MVVTPEYPLTALIVAGTVTSFVLVAIRLAAEDEGNLLSIPSLKPLMVEMGED